MLGTRQIAPESPSWACFRSADPHKVPIDPNGNLATKTEGTDVWAYEWNAQNELTRVTKNSVEQARFAYDPAGRRVEKVAGGVTTTYTYEGDDILREVRGATTFKYVHGPGVDEPLAREDGSGTLLYYQADGLGSIVKRTNQAGAIVHEYGYDSWGNIETGASEPGYSFTSREWEPEVGLYYYRARYYDPKIGRFVSEDPIRFRGGMNFFAYVQGNPVRAIDPSGLLRIRITYDTAYDYPIPFHGVTDVFDVQTSTAAESCKEQPCGKYQLEFTASATVLMRIGAGCPDATREHESAHAQQMAARIRAWFSQLAGFEGQYDSYGECARAWEQGMALLQRTRPSTSPWKKFAHYFQYIPCVN